MAAATAAVAACVASTYDEGCATEAFCDGAAVCLGAEGFDAALGASGRAMRLSVGFFAGFCWVCCAGA